MYRFSDQPSDDMPEDLSRFSGVVPPIGLQKGICEFLKRVRYRVVSERADLEAVGAMRYQSYREMDLVGETESGTWLDSFDEDPGYRNIAVFLDGELAGGVRINRVTPSMRRSAVADMYPGKLEEMLSGGQTFVEATRFFTSPALGRRNRELPFSIIRLVGIAGRYHRATHILKNVQANHAPFYERHLRAKIVPDSLLPYRNHSRDVRLLLVTAEVAPSYEAMRSDHQYLLSTMREMSGLFGPSPAKGDVLPGAVSVLDGSEQYA
jgi:N-acyl-L-homoserine lactone synthetase